MFLMNEEQDRYPLLNRTISLFAERIGLVKILLKMDKM